MMRRLRLQFAILGSAMLLAPNAAFAQETTPEPVITPKLLQSPVTLAPIRRGLPALVTPAPLPSVQTPLPTSPPTAAPATPAPSTVPAPTPAPTLPPRPSPTPVAASPSPYKYSFQPPAPTQDAPRIIEIDISDRFIHAGMIQLRIVADSSVTSMIVRSMGHEFAVPAQGGGVFMASNRVPSIPFFLKGRTLWVDFVASRRDGRQTVVSLPVVLS